MTDIGSNIVVHFEEGVIRRGYSYLNVKDGKDAEFVIGHDFTSAKGVQYKFFGPPQSNALCIYRDKQFIIVPPMFLLTDDWKIYDYLTFTCRAVNSFTTADDFGDPFIIFSAISVRPILDNMSLIEVKYGGKQHFLLICELCTINVDNMLSSIRLDGADWFIGLGKNNDFSLRGNKRGIPLLPIESEEIVRYDGMPWPIAELDQEQDCATLYYAKDIVTQKKTAHFILTPSGECKPVNVTYLNS